MIGREYEQRVLRAASESAESQLVVVYGRRRVGKTYLVRETFGNRFAFSHTGVEDGTMREELLAFWDSLRDYGWDCERPKDWLDAFAELKKLLAQSTDEKKIVFIDELPWMDTHRSGFLKVFEKFWNGWASARHDIMLIVCGSAASWMSKNVLNHKGGLFNRSSRQLYVLPFTLRECEILVRQRGLQMDRRDIVSAYMVFGGAAYYWTLLDPAESLAQNIDRLFFFRNGELANEFRRLYRSLFTNPDPYVAIVTALGTKKIGLSREELCAAGVGIVNNGNLTECLENLELSGFVRRYSAFGYAKRGSLYQLVDNFTLFYFKFVKENLRKDEHFWSHAGTSPVRRVWEGLAFERVCLEHLPSIKAALGIAGVSASCSSWRQTSADGEPKGAQIDLVIDRDDRVVNLCEMKFTKGEYEIDADEADRLRNRIEALAKAVGPRGNVHLTLVTAGGLKRNKYSNLAQSVIALDDLFRA